MRSKVLQVWALVGVSLCWAVASAWGAKTSSSTGVGVHPQDGAHVDFRVTIAERGVRSSISINLAFIDHVADVQRESPEAVSGPTEERAVMDALLNHLRVNCPVTINGRVVEPEIVESELFTDPDQAMLPLFPKSGMRGLIRATVVLEYPAEEPPQTATITWDGYPLDQVSGEVGPDGTPPPMTIECQLRAEGKLKLVRFSEAKPTIAWQHSENDENPFALLPEVPEGEEPRMLPIISIASGSLAVMLLGVCLVIMARGKTPVTSGVLAGVLIVSTGLTLEIRSPVPGSATGTSELTESERAEIFQALHENLYRAFDYADESDVYDALDHSVNGELREEMYRQIYRSLVQAEQGGMLGIVTGVEPISTELLDNEGLKPHGFTAHHVWQVEGTVYHWGHSHSRVNEYEAEFDIEPTDSGWRIVAQRVLRQLRVDDPELAPGLPAELSPDVPLGEI